MNKILILLLAVFTTGFLNAQRDETADKRKALKVGYVTERLNLTSEEAAKFWPIFNEFESEREAIRRESPTNLNAENLSEKDADLIIKQTVESKEKEIALLKKYIERFKTALPLQKVVKLLLLEKEFKQDLAEAVKNRSENRRLKRRN